jgi:hypothetical protein
VRATSADRSEDILVWTSGPRRIDRLRVRFPIENVDSRARFQTPIKKDHLALDNQCSKRTFRNSPLTRPSGPSGTLTPIAKPFRRLSRVTVGPNSR